MRNVVCVKKRNRVVSCCIRCAYGKVPRATVAFAVLPPIDTSFHCEGDSCSLHLEQNQHSLVTRVKSTATSRNVDKCQPPDSLFWVSEPFPSIQLVHAPENTQESRAEMIGKW